MISTTFKDLLNRFAGTVGNATQLGTALEQKVGCAKAVYDVATNGGAVGDHVLGVKLPKNAIIKNVEIDIVTAFASAGNAGTIAFKAQGAGDLLAAVDADTLANQVAGVPVYATVAGHIKLTAERELTATVAVEALTSGKAVLFVDYVLSEDA